MAFDNYKQTIMDNTGVAAPGMLTGPKAPSTNTTTTTGGGTTGGGTLGHTVPGTNTQKGTTNSTTTSSSQNMDSTSLAALMQLIAQLQGGGTPEMVRDREAKIKQQQALILQQAGYTKGAAQADSQGAMAQNMRLSMEQLLPSLVRASEGAGTSQNSMRALLLQKGATQAAEATSALGLKAAVDYGNISNANNSILSQLVSQQDPAVTALLNALNTAKGAVTTSTQTTKGTTTGSTKNATTNADGVPIGGVNWVNNNPYPSTTFNRPAAAPVEMMTLAGNFNPSGVSPKISDPGAFNPDGSMKFQGLMDPNQTEALMQMLSGAPAFTGKYTF